MIVWKLRGNIIRTAVCWIVWHSVHSQQHSYISSSYRSNRLGLSHWDPYAVRKGSCLELYYSNMVEWFWWDSSLISTTYWFPSVLWHSWFGHLPLKIDLKITYNVGRYASTLLLLLHPWQCCSHPGHYCRSHTFGLVTAVMYSALLFSLSGTKCQIMSLTLVL